MKKLLFISHDASQTGAPILLLNLIKWLVDNKQNDFKINLILGKGGPLEQEFSRLVPTTVVYKEKKLSLLKKGIQKIVPYKPLISFRNKKWDLIFSNTIVNGKILEMLHLKNTPTISFIHELEYSIKNFLKQGGVQGTFNYSNLYLCGSKLVQKTLVNHFQINPSNTKVVYSFQKISAIEKDKNCSAQIKKELEIPEDAKVVGMVGSFVWRKGYDFFVNTANLLNDENIYFIWIGANNKVALNKIDYDLKRVEKKPKIKLIPASPDYKKYFNCMDVFYLSSREDPYPMVMLDATCYGLPILCFKNAGGTQEFIDEKVGVVLPYGDIYKAAKTIKEICLKSKKLEASKNYIQQKSIQIHDVNNQASKIYDIIIEQINI